MVVESYLSPQTRSLVTLRFVLGTCTVRRVSGTTGTVCATTPLRLHRHLLNVYRAGWFDTCQVHASILLS